MSEHDKSKRSTHEKKREQIHPQEAIANETEIEDTHTYKSAFNEKWIGSAAISRQLNWAIKIKLNR